MITNIILYFLVLLIAHLIHPELFLPMNSPVLGEVLAYRILIFLLTSLCIMIITYFVEHFVIQVQESNEENLHLIKKQLRYYKDIDLLDTELRKFRHDIKNHFICLESLFKNDNKEELEAYFQQLQESFSFQDNVYFSGNDIIDAILHHDLPHLCEKEVKVTIYGNLPSIDTVSKMDLCTIFSNLLSNAIDSANQCIGISSPEISIHFSGGKKFFSIEVTNSVLPQISETSRKKKDRNHGYGMLQIQSVLEKYNGQIEHNVANNMVSLTIYLPV